MSKITPLPKAQPSLETSAARTAAALRTYYESLLQQGFSATEALTLVAAYQMWLLSSARQQPRE